MSSIGQIYYHVLDNNTGEYISNVGTFFDTNLIDGKTVTKLGIQAEPGTKVQVNTKDIMIGRTGIYELDADIRITTVIFPTPTNYIKLVNDTNNELEDGGQGLIAIEKERSDALAELGSAPSLFYLKSGKTYYTNTGLSDNPVTVTRNTAIYNVDLEQTGYVGFTLANNSTTTYYCAVDSVLDNNEAYISYWNNYVNIQTKYDAQYDQHVGTYNQGIAGVYTKDEQNPGDLYNVVIDYIYED